MRNKVLIVALLLVLLFVADLEAKKSKRATKEKDSADEKPAAKTEAKKSAKDDDDDLDDDDDDLDLDDDDLDDDLDDDDDDDAAKGKKKSKASKKEKGGEKEKDDDSSSKEVKKESKKEKKEKKESKKESKKSASSEKKSDDADSKKDDDKDDDKDDHKDDEKDDEDGDDDLDDEDDVDDDEDDEDEEDDVEDVDDADDDEDDEDDDIGPDRDSSVPADVIAKFNKDGNAILGECDYVNFPYDFEEHFSKVEKRVVELETVNSSIPHKTLFEFSAKSQAFITKGATDIAKWNASKDWVSDEYLIGKVGKKQIVVEMQKDGKIFGADSERLNMSVSRFLSINKNEGAYSYFVADLPLKEQLRQLNKDWKMPSCLAGEGAAAFAFFGAGGEIIPLHFEAEHNLYAVIEGQKKFVLYPPSDLKHLYPFQPHPEGAWSTSSLTTHPNVDKKKLSQFAKATKIEITVNAGQMIFVPALWWHEITNVGKTKAIAFLFVNDYPKHTQKEMEALSQFLITRASRRFATDAGIKKIRHDEL